MILRDVESIRIRASGKTTFLFVRLRTEDQQSGLGEATMSGSDTETATHAARLFATHLAGRPLDEVGQIVSALQAEAGDRPSMTLATAISALEQALWDLRGQQLELPIHALLGGARRTRVPLYANVNRGIEDRSAAGFAQRARAAVGAGFHAVKVAPFDGVEPDRLGTHAARAAITAGVDRVRAVREAIGDEADLLVDCHGRFDAPEALRVAESLRPARLYWYEEPVLTHPDLLALAAVTARPEAAAEARQPGFGPLQQVAASSPFPLAGGEFFFGLHQFMRLLRTGGLRYVMPDVKHCGGLWEALRIATLAEALGVGVAPHNPSGPVATLASVHLAAALPSFDRLEFQWGEVPWRGELLDPPEEVVDGCLQVPRGPGLGARLAEDVVSGRRIALDKPA